MRSHNRRLVQVTAMLTASMLTLAGCGAVDGDIPRGLVGELSNAHQNMAAHTIMIGTAQDSTSSAPEIPEAVRGGTVYVLDRDDFSHLDPGRIWNNHSVAVSTLFTRQLTGYQLAADSTIKLVGDLATDTGTTPDGGRTWKFTLKDGVKWQDGSPVTSEDIKHSFERLFADFITEGPTYAQEWLVPDPKRPYREQYQGPYAGKRLDSIETPDDKTVIFHLNQARPDFNFTVAMTGYGAVPKAHDTREEYDKKPLSCGPYQITSHITDKSLDLVRNPYWDGSTDPIRHAYPDAFHMEFGLQPEQTTERFLADVGTDKFAFTFNNSIAPERVQKVLNDPELMRRSVRGVVPFTSFYAINTSRITDINVRKAIIKAWPYRKIQQIQGGPAVTGMPATTVLNPTVIGYEPFDLYGKRSAPDGDIEEARKLLARSGTPHPKIVYAYNQIPTEERVSIAVKDALSKAGFTVVTKSINPKTYYDTITQVDNPYDIYWMSWAADWPTGSTTITPLFDGRAIADGGMNVTHLNNPKINKAIDKAAAITDLVKAGKAWAALDRMVMEQAVIVPSYYKTYFGLHGSGLGGVRMHPLYGGQSALDIWIK